MSKKNKSNVEKQKTTLEAQDEVVVSADVKEVETTAEVKKADKKQEDKKAKTDKNKKKAQKHHRKMVFFAEKNV